MKREEGREGKGEGGEREGKGEREGRQGPEWKMLKESI